LKGFVEGKRPIGRPRGRWIAAVEKDAENLLKCKNWRKSAGGQMIVDGRLKRPRPRLGCSATGNEEVGLMKVDIYIPRTVPLIITLGIM
jgi:hypothetical protein